MKNKIFDKIASLFRKSEIEKQVQKSHRKEAIPEQEHARHKGIGNIKERLSSIFVKRRKAEERRLERSATGVRSDTTSNYRKDISVLPTESDVTIDNLLEQFHAYSDPMNKAGEQYIDVLSKILDDAIETYGRDEVIKRLKAHAPEVNKIVGAVHRAYESDVFNENVTRFASICRGGSLNKDESSALSEVSESFYEPVL